MCVEGRDHESRTRHRDDHVHVCRRHAGGRQALFGRLPSQAHRMFLVLAARLLQRPRFDEVLDREDRVALGHLRVVDHRHHGVEAPTVEVEDLAHVVLHALARQQVIGNGRCRRRDRRRWAVLADGP